MIKMSFLSKLIYRFNAIPIKIPVSYLVDIDRVILNFIRRGKRPRMINTTQKERNKFEGLIPCD